MRIVLTLLFITLALPSHGQTAITGVTIILPQGEERAEQTVLLEGDRIVSVGGNVDVPVGAEIIDGSGKFLIPGLGEMHGHIPPLISDRQYIEDVLFLYVANGVTTVRGMLGTPGQLGLKDRIASGELVGPTLYLAGPSFNGNSVSSPDQAEAMVERQVAQGWDLLKVHPGLTRAEYDAMAAKADELGIDFAGHVPADVGIMRAIDAKQRSIDHLDGYIAYLAQDEEITDEELAAITAMTRDAGVAVVPTMALWETVIGASDLDAQTAYPELAYMPPDTVAGWTRAVQNRLNPAAKPRALARLKLLKALNEGGVEMLFGTDAPQLFSVPGFSVHRETSVMAAAGMSPVEILDSATVAVGRYFAGKDSFGRIEAGQRADLVLLDKDPHSDVAHLRDPAAVILRGQVLDRAAIQARLARIAAQHR